MPNLYVTPEEIRTTAPDLIRDSVTTYDDSLYRLADRVSRMIDDHTNREFYPYSEQRVFTIRRDAEEVLIDDLISATTVEISRDEGSSYLASSDFGASDYLLARGENLNPRQSYDRLIIDRNGAVGSFPAGQRALRVTGIWGFVDSRDDVWRTSGDTLQSNVADSDTSLSVSDADAADLFGVTPNFQKGQLLRLDDSEFVENTAVDTGTDTITVVRGRNGTTASSHASGVAIDIFDPPEPIRQAAMIQVMRSLMRAKQAYQDASANPDLGQMFFVQDIDPEAAVLLRPYKRTWVA